MAAKAWTDSEIILAISQAGERLGPRQQWSAWNFNSVSAITKDWLPCSRQRLLLTATKHR